MFPLDIRRSLRVRVADFRNNGTSAHDVGVAFGGDLCRGGDIAKGETHSPAGRSVGIRAVNDHRVVDRDVARPEFDIHGVAVVNVI